MEHTEGQLKVSHRPADCFYWNMFSIVPVVTAGMAILKHSVTWTIVYILLTILTFAVAVYRFFCTHCPHYIQSDQKVSCLFLCKVPKYFKARPGPYSFTERFIVLMSLLIWMLFPVYWLYKSIGLLVIYGVSLTALVATLRRYECGRCIHFDCPSNKVPEDVRVHCVQAHVDSSDRME
jgi:hypothetical protein